MWERTDKIRHSPSKGGAASRSATRSELDEFGDSSSLAARFRPRNPLPFQSARTWPQAANHFSRCIAP